MLPDAVSAAENPAALTPAKCCTGALSMSSGNYYGNYKKFDGKRMQVVYWKTKGL